MRNHSPSNHTAFKRDLNVENMLCISNHMATHVRIYYYYTILYYVILLYYIILYYIILYYIIYFLSQDFQWQMKV